MKENFEEIISLSYKNRFSMYYKPGCCLIRTYFSDGKQHKEIGKTITETIDKMTKFLKSQK